MYRRTALRHGRGSSISTWDNNNNNNNNNDNGLNCHHTVTEVYDEYKSIYRIMGDIHDLGEGKHRATGWNVARTE
jgi:hypothetical protein